MSSPKPNRCRLAQPLNLSKFNESATNYARNSSDALQEAHQMHRDLRHSRADVVVKEAFISDLRQQLLAIDPLVSQRDQLATGHKRLSAKCEQLVARRHQLVEERRRLLARQEALETKLRALQTYVNSAGFRIVESVTRHLRRFPTAFRTTRTIARKVVGRSAAPD